MKNKKTKEVSSSESYKIVQKHGLDVLKAMWIENGMYDTARMLDTSPYVIRFLSNKFAWLRPASTCPHLVKAVKAGRAQASTYKHLDWSEIELPTNNRGE